jgi:hypothetical protein
MIFLVTGEESFPNKSLLLVASKGIDLKVNAEKNTFMCMSREKNTEKSQHNDK